MRDIIQDIYPFLTDKILGDERTYTWSKPKHGIFYGSLLGKRYARPLFTRGEMLEQINGIKKLLNNNE